MNGNENIPRVPDKATAKTNVNIPKRNVIIANRIFIEITHIKPSRSQLKMSPGSLIDNEEPQRNTSAI